MRKSVKSSMFILITLLCVSLLAACGSSKPADSQAEQQVGEQKEQGYGTLEIVNMGHKVTFTQPPKRAVSLNQHATEIMLALGLEKSMVGTAYLDDAILPQYKDVYGKIPVLAEHYPSKEVLLAAEPDFAYAGWKSAFTDKELGSREELEKLGIHTYIQESSNKSAPTLEDVYQDISNIGRIFGVQDKADALIAGMKQEIDATLQKIGEIKKPLDVFVYDSGEDKAFTAANNYMTQLINLAGAKNIFDDIQKTWAEVSWESVIERNPEVIIIVDYGDHTVKQKEELLLSKKELSDVTAIKEKKFIVLPLSACAEGIRAPIALNMLAEGLYPDIVNH